MLVFMLGMICAIFIIPIIEGLRDLLLTAMENLKSRLAVRIYKNNQTLNAPNENTQVIGFVAPAEEWEEEDDD